MTIGNIAFGTDSVNQLQEIQFHSISICSTYMIGTGAIVPGDINWLTAFSAGAFGVVTALLLALTSLPEAAPDSACPEE